MWFLILWICDNFSFELFWTSAYVSGARLKSHAAIANISHKKQSNKNIWHEQLASCIYMSSIVANNVRCGRRKGQASAERLEPHNTVLGSTMLHVKL